MKSLGPLFTWASPYMEIKKPLSYRNITLNHNNLARTRVKTSQENRLL